MCVRSRIYSFALVTELRSEETSFLNSAGIVELNYIKEGSSNPGFHGTQAFGPVIQYSCMHSGTRIYTPRIVTLGSRVWTEYDRMKFLFLALSRSYISKLYTIQYIY